MKTYISGIFLLIGILFGMGGVEARVPEPLTIPETLKGTSPHQPVVARYYLEEFVKQRKITVDEANRIEVYMIFRYARRTQDLAEVEGLDIEKRRAVMRQKRMLRENPLVEFANHCGFSLNRAKEIMDILHDSDKGTRYYLKQKENQREI